MMRVDELAKTLDHTLLDPRATHVDVVHACSEARRHHVATVCSFPAFLPTMREHLRGGDVKACAAVAFPHGADLAPSKVAAVEQVVAAGADEVDVMMNVPAMRSGDFRLVRDELVGVVRAARARAANGGRGDVIVKVVIQAPYLDDKLTRLACKIVADAGADFAKTATGVGARASVRDVELMREALPECVGVAAAGGIRTLEEAELMLNAGAARIGSSAAVELVRELARLDGAVA
jgi:deoxyribose-phosphate aldolase